MSDEKDDGASSPEVVLTEGEGLLALSDAVALGTKLAEMADRVKVMHAVIPGAQASWGFDVDDTHFKVVVTVAPKN